MANTARDGRIIGESKIDSFMHCVDAVMKSGDFCHVRCFYYSGASGA
jgi:hypothetical protein